jgi:hypothetical protein
MMISSSSLHAKKFVVVGFSKIPHNNQKEKHGSA